VPINPSLVRKYALLFLVLILLGIYFGGEQPGAGQLFLPPWDKVVHFITFGGIGVLVGLAWPRISLFKVLLIVMLIGMSDEFHQLFIAGRVAGLDDLAADIIGGGLALPVLTILRKNLYPKANSLNTNIIQTNRPD
jgi:VanZ family protein